MSPVIHSPVSPAGSLFGNSFDGISFAPSSDSLCPLLSSADDSDHPSLFDTYISEMVAKDMQRMAMRSASDLSEASRSSTDESAMPVSPSQGTITPETVRPHKVKKKRSLGDALKALKPSTQSSDHPKNLKRIPPVPPVDDTSLLTVDSEDLPGSMGLRREEEDTFDDRNRTVRRRNMPHHPFRYEDVPYMQAYSQILLENDFQTHELLRRLTPPDSPTFHNFGKKPPAEVLDLGCGEGFWVLHAAKLWKSHHTKVTGLDLIDLHNNHCGEVSPKLEPAHTPKNVTWFRSNFVKYQLPFPDASFDLVRMANLTLCIPIKRWGFVLTEVRRVLKPGGRLELIDDDMFFPTIPPHPRIGREPAPPPPPKDAPGSPPRFRTQRAPSHSRAENPFKTRAASLTRSASQKYLPDLPRRPGSPGPANKRHARSASEIEYGHNAAIASQLETIFDNMLHANGIASHPHEFLGRLLREVFGPDCARQTQNLELAVPSRELFEGVTFGGPKEHPVPLPSSAVPNSVRRSEEGEKGRPSWMTIEWDHKKDKKSEKASLNSVRTSEDSLSSSDSRGMNGISPKARQLLFGDDKTLAMMNVGPYQPPGLLLLPSTFIPCSPLELEMHACKNMNTLLGCKYALSKFMTNQRAPDGTPLLSEKEVDDYLWDYECFRRKRFNWPQDIPSIRMEEETESTQSPQPHKPALFRFGSDTGRSNGAPMYGGVNASKDTSTHVRTIRVYEALKMVALCGCHHRTCTC
ncbi:hypothetical protein C8Q77DRAFT_1152924 [Trametes polyzona]|nr:hypothetical protein C8Q77DRAFT_1152924 [Trametes polyzona]